MAPEILLNKQNAVSKANDMWAIGVIAYILVCQEPPLKYGGSQGNLVGKAAIEDFR